MDATTSARDTEVQSLQIWEAPELKIGSVTQDTLNAAILTAPDGVTSS